MQVLIVKLDLTVKVELSCPDDKEKESADDCLHDLGSEWVFTLVDLTQIAKESAELRHGTFLCAVDEIGIVEPHEKD